MRWACSLLVLNGNLSWKLAWPGLTFSLVESCRYQWISGTDVIDRELVLLRLPWAVFQVCYLVQLPYGVWCPSAALELPWCWPWQVVYLAYCLSQVWQVWHVLIGEDGETPELIVGLGLNSNSSEILCMEVGPQHPRWTCRLCISV